MKLKALLGWSIGSFTSATLIGAVGLLHLRFLTDSLGISIGLAGSFVVLSRLYDAAFDPVMGVISDYTRTPLGRYRPYLLIGGLLAAASLIVMFNVPYALKGVGLSIYVIFSLFFFSTAYTMFRIPYLAIGRSITQDFTERSRLMSFSVYGSSLGGLAATAAAPFLLAKLGSDRAGHGLVALLLAGFIAAGAIASFILIKADGEAAPAPGVTRHRLTVRESLAALRANHPFQCLISFKMLMFAGLSVHISSIPYYTRYVLKRSDTALSSIFLAQTLAMMASQFVWVRLARRFGRRNALLTAGLLQTVTMLCWFLVPRGSSSPWVQILGAMEGFCGGGMFFGLYTVLTDTMDYARRKSSGAGQEGILAGIFVMVEKATTAFGTAVFGGVLASVGYISAHNAGTAQPPAVLTGICISMSVIPAALGLIACLFIYKYRLPGLEIPASPVELGATESVSPLGMPTA